MNIAIIGAGTTGLTAGYDLARRGHTVRIFECEDRIGGLASTLPMGQTRLETFYHHLFTSDTDFVDLAEEMGLGDRLVWKAPRNGIYVQNRLYPFTSPKDLLFFRALSIRDRIALGLLTLRARKVRDWPALENQTAKDWVIQTAGENVYEKFWRPLLEAKFDRDADRISATWLGNKIKLRGSTRGKNPSREVLGYATGSFQIVYDELVRQIEARGGKCNLARPVKRITPQLDGSVDVDGEKFDAALVTAAPAVLADLVPNLPDGCREKIRALRYKANVCLLLELNRPLSDFYWISVAQSDIPFVAVIEHTNLFPDPGYGSTIVYLSRYLDEQDPLFIASDAEITNRFLDALRRMFAHFSPSSMIASRVHRARFAQPVIATGYSKTIPDLKVTGNLYLASMAQIYPEDRGQNYAVRMGRQVAERIHEGK